ncbi:hypothetical protein B0T10DRAFT_460005 [Thelonectria olida]|uniref:Uncharacterized protein n=1 Tax=Thelonectria olida TaxID=1576542 RepID=A0A9P9AQ79_9HYPO|nr:hypothetical protein B0T10DRAFT_460005 [Thelonectria olida]
MEGEAYQGQILPVLKSTTGEGKRAESLAGSVLKDVLQLATDCTFKTATAVQMEDLRRAIEDLANLEPENESDKRGGSQTYNGKGIVYAHYGHGHIQSTEGGDIVGRDKVVGTGIRPQKRKCLDTGDDSTD